MLIRHKFPHRTRNLEWNLNQGQTSKHCWTSNVSYNLPSITRIMWPPLNFAPSLLSFPSIHPLVPSRDRRRCLHPTTHHHFQANPFVSRYDNIHRHGDKNYLFFTRTKNLNTAPSSTCPCHNTETATNLTTISTQQFTTTTTTSVDDDDDDDDDDLHEILISSHIIQPL